MCTVPPRHAWKNTSFGLFLRNVQLVFVNGEIISLILTAWPSLPNIQLSFPWLMTNMTKHSSFSRLSSWLIFATVVLICCRHFKHTHFFSTIQDTIKHTWYMMTTTYLLDHLITSFNSYTELWKHVLHALQSLVRMHFHVYTLCRYRTAIIHAH